MILEEPSGGGKRGEARVACLFDDLAAKFVKDVRTIRRKDDKFETEAICRHSERLAKKSAFTLAEVLITLGIIGVVAAVTLPTLVANYQKTVWVNQLKKTYSTLNEGFKQIVANEGCTTLECAGLSGTGNDTGFDFSNANTKDKFVKEFKLENVFVGEPPSNSIYNYKVKTLSGYESSFQEGFIPDNEYSLSGTTTSGEIISIVVAAWIGPIIVVDINGLKSPNTIGRDIFMFSYFDYNDSVMVVSFFSRNNINWYQTFDNTTIETEEERIQAVNSSCSVIDESTGMDSMTCAEKIIMDGWKMNY